MGRDDSATLAALKAHHRKELIDPKIAEYDGQRLVMANSTCFPARPSIDSFRWPLYRLHSLRVG
jgi:hypothetical protein